jgi:hypothetical protein
VPFACSICEQESTRICAFCTKDACAMHICEHCGCCSDCCSCDVPLDEVTTLHAATEPVPELEPVPAPEASAPPEPQPAPPEEPFSGSLETPEI